MPVVEEVVGLIMKPSRVAQWPEFASEYRV